MSKNEYICDCNIIHQDAVDRVNSKIISQKTSRNLSKFLKVLGDNTRIRIVSALDENEMCVCDLANVLKMTKSAVSHQLRILKDEKLIKNRREGREVFYFLADNHVKEVFEMSLEHINE